MNALKAIARRHQLAWVKNWIAQPVHIAQVATISGNMVGDDNHHCRERKIQAPGKRPSERLRTPSWRKNHAGASTSAKILANQQKENPRSKSKIKNPQSCGRNQVV